MTTINPLSKTLPGSRKHILTYIGLLNRDLVTSLILAVLSLITRLPFTTRVLYHWDSVNFAFAMRQFNLAQDQPQPPGYIFYVWLTRAVDLIFHDANTTMVAISVVGSLLSVIAIFFLGKSMINRTVGLLAALFLVFSPLFWFYGEIALPHVLDALLATIGAWWLYETMKGDYRYLYPAVVVMVIAGGIRQQTLVFMAPLIIFAMRKVGWKRIILAGLLGGVLCLTWLLPLLALSGGLTSYLKIMNDFTVRFQSTTSLFLGAGWFGLNRNVTKYMLYTLYGWSLFLLPVGASVLTFVRGKLKIQSLERWIFLALWIAPATIFYFLVHMGQQGLVLVYLPALLIISAAALEGLLVNQRKWMIATVGALIIINAFIFLVLPEYPLGPAGQRLLTRATLVNSDQYFTQRFAAIQKNYPPATTVIIALNWHHLQYYLPGYKILPFNIGAKREVDEGQPVDNTGNTLNSIPSELGLVIPLGSTGAMIIFDPDLDPFNKSKSDFKDVSNGLGGSLELAPIHSTDHIVVQLNSFSIVQR